MNKNKSKDTIEISLKSMKIDSTYKIDSETKEALIQTAGAEITEAAANKMVTIFESAVNAKVKQMMPAVVKLHENAMIKKFGAVRKELQENISNYLGYVVEEWFDTNKQSVAESLRAERDSTLVNKIAQVMEKHWVSMPKRKSIVEGMAKNVKKLEEQVEKTVASEMKLKNKINGLRCEKIFNRLAEGLAQTDAEKFMTLVESFSISDVKEFESKASLVKKTYFGKKKVSETKESVDASRKDATGAFGKTQKQDGGKRDVIAEAANLLRSPQ